MQARHDRERYDRQHDDPTSTTGADDMEGTYTGNIVGGGSRVGRHGEHISGSISGGSGGGGGDVDVASTDINAGDPVISRTSEYVHAVMSSSSHPQGESQRGASMSMFSANANARREESLNRSHGDFTTGDVNVSGGGGGGGTYNTGGIEKTARKRASSVDRQQTHPFDRVSESLLGPTGEIHPLFLLC